MKNVPWIDKYRPHRLDDIVFQNEVKTMLKSMIKNNSLPHLLFYGSPGTGKTSTILALAHELFNSKYYKDRVIELNASDERGIDIVRGKILTFAKLSIHDDENSKVPPYKLIIMDEADAMTTEAQSALRKTIEDRSSNTRFCFICNYINKIITPIASRCVKVRFKQLNESCIIQKLQNISIHENIVMTPDIYDTIASLSNGDMRKGIMLLQKSMYLKKEITVDDIYYLANYIPAQLMSSIHATCFTDTNTSKILELCKEIKQKAYPINNILLELNKLIINDTSITDKQKALMIITMSDIERKLIDGANEYIQMTYLLLFIHATCNKKN